MHHVMHFELLCLTLLASACTTQAEHTAALESPPQLQAAAEAAFEYGYPLTEMMRVCDTLPQVNHLYAKATLATPADRNVVMPNNDTLYSAACLYLGSGWVQVTMPAAGSRYMSAQIFDAYTNSAALVSAREHGSERRTIVLRFRGANNADTPAGLPVFEVSTPYAMAVFRTLVSGPGDLNAAKAAQSGITLQASASDPPNRRSAITGTTNAQTFFSTLSQRLAQNPPPDAEAGLVASFAKVGVRASLTPDLSRISQAQLAAWDSAYANGFIKLQREAASRNEVRGTWAFPRPDIATPGKDYTLRAVIARYGLFPLPPSESIYPFTIADGSSPHMLKLPRGWHPIDAGGFWSLTMYADSYLVDNPIHRYSLGDRTPGLNVQPDGSVDIYIQCSDPGESRRANWLPAPCGPYILTMRLYLPNASARRATFTLPALQ